jgi:hypothetical protein
MKKLLLVLIPMLLAVIAPCRASAQYEELEQLALDIEKLVEMKSILKEMYTGYKILTDGYNTVKSIAEGNFNLHNAYLNGLLQVTPGIKNYVRVADIISAQAELVTEYKAAMSTFSKSGSFSATELNYITGVYSNLFSKSLDDLDALVMVLTSGTLRASDAERLAAIDGIYNKMQDKLSFLRMFNGKAGILATQRQTELQQTQTLQSLYGQ